MYPGLSSWAKFSRPSGTKLVNPEFTQTLKPTFVAFFMYGPKACTFQPASFRKLLTVQFLDRDLIVGINADLAGNPQGLFRNGTRRQIGVLHQGASRR